jgi:hypothetical protein
MRNALLTLSVLLCACSHTPTSYEQAIDSLEYVGNGRYSIWASGNAYTYAADIERFVYRKAFETCANEGKGFAFAERGDQSSHVQFTQRVGNALMTTDTDKPGLAAQFVCQGEIDERFSTELAERQIAAANAVAAEVERLRIERCGTGPLMPLPQGCYWECRAGRAWKVCE